MLSGWLHRPHLPQSTLKSNGWATCGCGFWLGPAGPPGVENDWNTSGNLTPFPAAAAPTFFPPGVSGC